MPTSALVAAFHAFVGQNADCVNNLEKPPSECTKRDRFAHLADIGWLSAQKIKRLYRPTSMEKCPPKLFVPIACQSPECLSKSANMSQRKTTTLRPNISNVSNVWNVLCNPGYSFPFPNRLEMSPVNQQVMAHRTSQKVCVCVCQSVCLPTFWGPVSLFFCGGGGNTFKEIPMHLGKGKTLQKKQRDIGEHITYISFLETSC